MSPGRYGGLDAEPPPDPSTEGRHVGEATQYHLPRTNPPNAMSPTSTTIRPIHRLQIPEAGPGGPSPGRQTRSGPQTGEPPGGRNRSDLAGDEPDRLARHGRAPLARCRSWRTISP